MSSATETAEQRFRLAFERLKDNKPHVLPRGTPVSQNNVAKEAGTDPTALRKARYPALVREIQAWVEINGRQRALQRKRQDRQRRNTEDLTAKVKRLEQQRDDAQSQLTSAQRLVLELLQENARLQARLDELRPLPTPLRR
ncbi:MULTISPECIES: hypothetical protein [unclassified Cupriavidus]|uniref:hypothetical protein n=1 Tax=unclassified Cupriavidus TaxID=2640874 RepID=UPI001BFFEAA5|nr:MULTISPECIES: hypothetical protein [unclassified Cupriavidus]MCA3193162.1 hypothetical protein [Cupriavidus sp.]MCA3194744.1 hypothetical protein [Cupriavidus sp.]MCA3202988.1 hypothetical protein [Cupriavidus sp.]MCA3206914.1 hypothetical protein [Cupriavidus sp.]MCA3232459.1 hypothetical protein [Cupriavidus sp.]